MVLLDTTDRLVAQLEKMITKRPPTGIEKMDAGKAYKKGLEDSLALVRTHLEQRKEGPESQPKKEKRLELFQMPPDRVIKMGLNDPEKLERSGVGLSDLIEAAFSFENRLLELLADDNTIPYDAYESLDSLQLGGIIHHCAEKILQLPSTNSGDS